VLAVAGLPLHPLVVHAVVVLLPLAALGAILLAAGPVWRRRFGVPLLLLAVAGVGAVPVATWSGEQLQAALPGPNPLILEHQARGDTLLPFAAGFLVLLAVAVLAGGAAPIATAPGRRAPRPGRPPSPRCWPPWPASP
jgi:uncharacterized membrane protein